MSEETNVWTPEATTQKCPNCGSRDTRKSLPRGALDTIFLMFNRSPYRCRKCAKRFIRKTPRPDGNGLPEPDKAESIKASE